MAINNKEILITGGTGSLGNALTDLLLSKYNPKGIRIYSRDELKQFEMKNRIHQKLPNPPVAFLIGDIRDRKRLELATEGVDILIHACALKQIGSCEDNPLEAINTNIIGAQNIIYASLKNKIKKVMGVSTDKACLPINLYGATKMCAEKLFIQSNVYSGGREPRFSCVRYGNVLGSRGSVVPLFRKQYKENKKVTITDPKMTRFWITLEWVSQFILDSINEMRGREIFIPKMPSANIIEIVKAIIREDNGSPIRFYSKIVMQPMLETIGIRPGEKLHETLITKEESVKVIENQVRFKITQEINLPAKAFEYRSDNNDQWLNYRQIRKMLK